MVFDIRKHCQGLNEIAASRRVGVRHSLAPLVPPKKTIEKKTIFATRYFVHHHENDVYLKDIKENYERGDVFDKSCFYSTFLFKRNIEFIFIHEVCDSPPLFKSTVSTSYNIFVV